MIQIVNRLAKLLAVLPMALAACSPAPTSPTATVSAAGAAQPAGPSKVALDKLVAQAKQEPVFDVMIASSAVKSAPKIVDAFKARFGLQQQKVNLNVEGGETGQFQKASAEIKAGAKPVLDVMQGELDLVANLTADDGNIVIPDWELLLAEIHPLVKSGQIKASDVSPSIFAGRGFMWATRTKALLYNTNLIAEADLPRARGDLADPKYMGKLATSPFTSDWQFGVLFYGKDEWLNIADKVGKNSVAVLNFDAQRDRMLLGEFPLSPSNSYYYFGVKATDKNAPIGVHYFTDYTAVPQVLYTVRKGAKATATGSLFALWATTPEFEQLHQGDTSYTNFFTGQTDLDKRERELTQKSGTKLVTWIDNDETRKMLDWFASAEGRAYNQKLAQALTQRK
jgi:hypothetical protein